MTVTPAGRAALDAYWTPFECARACCRVLRDEGVSPDTILEPAVGGGAWVHAAREAWPEVLVDALDIDPRAPGLAEADGQLVGDFRTFVGRGYGLVLGNPPYGGDLMGWLDHSLRVGNHVAYLLAANALGSGKRAGWWEAHRPAVVWTLVGRPNWEGPGARETGPKTDAILVLWSPPRPAHDTALRWLRWKA